MYFTVSHAWAARSAELPRSCSDLKNQNRITSDGHYFIKVPGPSSCSAQLKVFYVWLQRFTDRAKTDYILCFTAWWNYFSKPSWPTSAVMNVKLKKRLSSKDAKDQHSSLLLSFFLCDTPEEWIPLRPHQDDWFLKIFRASRALLRWSPEVEKSSRGSKRASSKIVQMLLEGIRSF